jgi:hypothetical protein
LILMRMTSSLQKGWTSLASYYHSWAKQFEFCSISKVYKHVNIELVQLEDEIDVLTFPLLLFFLISAILSTWSNFLQWAEPGLICSFHQPIVKGQSDRPLTSVLHTLKWNHNLFFKSTLVQWASLLGKSMKDLKASAWHPVGTSNDVPIFVIMVLDVSTSFKTCDGASRIMTCADAAMLFTFGTCSVEVDALVKASEQVSVISLWHREKQSEYWYQ